MSGGVYNVTVFNIQMSRALRGLYIKSGEGRGGTVRGMESISSVSFFRIPISRGSSWGRDNFGLFVLSRRYLLPQRLDVRDCAAGHRD